MSKLLQHIATILKIQFLFEYFSFSHVQTFFSTLLFLTALQFQLILLVCANLKKRIGKWDICKHVGLHLFILFYFLYV